MSRILFRTLAAMLLCAALLSPSFARSLPAPGAVDATVAEHLFEKKENGTLPDLTFLDVRTPGEFAAGHLPGALNIPLNELKGRLPEVPEGPVVIVCRSGRRAASAYRVLVGSGRPSDQLWHYVGYIDYAGEKPRFRD